MMMMAAAVALAAITMVSCDKNGSATLKDGVDSLAYDCGVFQSEGLKQYVTMQLGIDSAYIDDFIKGMKEGAMNEADPKKEAYLSGLAVGKDIQNMSKSLTQQVYGDDSTKSVNVKVLLAGFEAGLKGKDGRTAEEAYNDFNESPWSESVIFTTTQKTSINEIQAEVKGDNRYYNMMGQEVDGNNLPAGIYIHNGKKILVK